MKLRKIFLTLVLSMAIIFSAVVTVNALERGPQCSNNTVKSSDPCITGLLSEFGGKNLFKLSYKFEVTGLSGGIGGGR